MAQTLRLVPARTCPCLRERPVRRVGRRCTRVPLRLHGPRAVAIAFAVPLVVLLASVRTSVGFWDAGDLQRRRLLERLPLRRRAQRAEVRADALLDELPAAVVHVEHRVRAVLHPRRPKIF